MLKVQTKNHNCDKPYKYFTLQTQQKVTKAAITTCMENLWKTTPELFQYIIPRIFNLYFCQLF